MTNQLPIYDCFGQQIKLVSNQHLTKRSRSSGIREQVDVDKDCQVMDSKSLKPIPGLFGIGQGYSLATSNAMVQAELRPGAKADSVGLYIKQLGNKILSQILPHSKVRYD